MTERVPLEIQAAIAINRKFGDATVAKSHQDDALVPAKTRDAPRETKRKGKERKEVERMLDEDLIAGEQA